MNVKIILALIALAFSCVALSAEKGEKETSADLYCKALVFGFLDTYKYLGKFKSSDEKVSKTAAEMERTCSNSPTPNLVTIATMSPTLISTVTCIGFAVGAQMAYTLDKPTEPYLTLDKRRNFAANACAANPKRFQNDIFKKGPDYVLTQKY